MKTPQNILPEKSAGEKPVADWQTDSHEIDDQSLSQLLHQLLPDAPPQPMFTRMVINRLNRRASRIASIIEYTLYIIGIATTGVIATNLVLKISSSSSVTQSQTLTLLTLVAVFFSLIYALISPFFGEQE